MKTITTEELKAKLDRGEPFKLVMAFDDWRFRAAHIPGSLGVGTPSAAMRTLSTSDEIVVYCTSAECGASQVLYRALDGAGYKNLRRYDSGVQGWQEAGYPLEGDKIE